MTLLDEPRLAPRGAPASVPTARPPTIQAREQGRPAAAESGSEALVRAVLILLVAAVVAVALWKAFDQVVAPAWYRNRQHHLAVDFTAQRTGLLPGQAVGVLQIPGIGANLMVIEGSDPNELRSGPGHRRGTPVPGDRGNSVIEGHRARWGAPFTQLPKLVKRTRIVTLTRSGIPVEYRVTAVRVVKRSRLAPYLAPSRDRRITLITHAGGSLSDDRLVVQAVGGTPSSKRGKGTAPPLDPPTGSLATPVLALALCSAGGFLAVARLRRDQSRASVGLVVVPLVLAAVLALLLAADTAVSSLL